MFSGVSWSIKKSGNAIDLNFKLESIKPFFDKKSITWEPKPPIDPSSIVIIASWVVANCQIRFSSKGFANLASTIVIFTPFFFKFSAAFNVSFNLAPKFRTANFFPSLIILDFPISIFSSIEGKIVPIPVPLGYLNALGLSLIYVEVLIILTSPDTSLAAITIKFGNVDK